MLPKNTTDIRQMAKVKYLPFSSQTHLLTLKFTVHIFMKLRNPTHIAKIKALKEEMENLNRQSRFCLSRFSFRVFLTQAHIWKVHLFRTGLIQEIS